MTAAVLTLATSIIGFIIWLWKRKVEAVVSLPDQLKAREDKNRKIIATGDLGKLNLTLDERLRAIDRAKLGQRSDETPKG